MNDRGTSFIKGIASSTRHDQLNMSTVIENAGTTHGYREIVTRMPDHWHRYTYRDMLARVRKLANVLKDLGVKEGEIVGIWGYNTYRHVELQFAISGIGATFHFVNFAVADEDLIYILNHGIKNAPYKVAFVEDNLVPRYEAIVPRLEKSFEKHVIFGDNEKNVSTKIKPIGFYEDLLNEAKPTFKWPEIEEYTAAIFMMTSATTGKPKALMHSHRAAWFQSMGQALSYSLTPMDCVVVLPPFTHGGWFFHNTAAMVGAKMVLPGPMAKANDFADCLIKEKATFVGGVPTMFAMALEDIRKKMANGEKVNLSGLKIFFAGQAPSEALITAYEQLGAKCVQGYAYSEGCGPEVVVYVPRPLEAGLSQSQYCRFIHESCGFPTLGVEVKIVGDDGKDLPHDGKSIGEVHTKIPWGVNEYWMMPEETKKGFDSDTWLKSADLASVDEAGCVRLHDRMKDAIKSGGEWISSPFVESIIASFNPVSEAAVIEAEHEKWGGRPVALVALTGEYKGKTTEKDIIDYLMSCVEKGTIAKFHIPDRIFIVDEIPKTANLKFDKKLMREKYRKVLVEK